MNKSVCYVLITDGRGPYAAMTYLSASCLRLVSPSIQIYLFTDPDSIRHLEANDQPLLEACDRVQIIDIPAGFDPTRANRYIKTKLRELMDGRILYLDSDTLPVRPLDDLFLETADFAACIDQTSLTHALEVKEKVLPDGVEPIYERFGWKAPPRRYYNGGVLFSNDTAAARDFYSLWHRRWMGCQDEGLPLDQPSLNSSINESAMKVKTLGHEYNAISKPRIRLNVDVRLYHYFAGRFHLKEELVIADLIDAYQAGRLDSARLRRLIRTRHIWKNVHWPRLYWASGMYLRALYWKARGLVPRTGKMNYSSKPG